MDIRRAERLITKELRAALPGAGFSRKGAVWYRHDREVTQVLAVRAGGRLVSVVAGAFLRRLNRATHPAIHDCHVRVGMSTLAASYTAWNGVREHTSWESEDDPRVKEFVAGIIRYTLPVLDAWRSEEGVRAYVRSPETLKNYVAEGWL